MIRFIIFIQKLPITLRPKQRSIA